MNEVKGGALLNYLNLFMRLGIGFFLSPFILYHLGTSQYGLYTIAGTIVGWLALMDFGLSSSTAKFLSEYQVKKDAVGEAHYLGNVAALFSVVGIAVLMAGLCIYPFLGDIFPKFTSEELSIYKVLYLMTLINTALLFPARSIHGIATSREKYIVPGIITTITSLCTSVGTVIILLLGYKSIALLGLTIGIGVFAMLWNVCYCFGILKARMSWNGFDSSLCKLMLSFSFWMFCDQIIGIMNWGMGSMVTGMRCGAGEVAIYSYGLQITNYFFMISTCISPLFLPRIVKILSGNNSSKELTNLMIRVGRMQFILLCSILLIFTFFGREFLTLWIGETLGEQTKEVWWVALILMCPMLLTLSQNLGWYIIQASNLMKLRVRIVFPLSLVGLFISYYLALPYGSVGVACGATAYTVLGGIIGLNILYKKKLQIEIRRFFAECFSRCYIWLPLLLLAGYLLNESISATTWFLLVVKVGLFLILYFALMSIIYFNREERISLLEMIWKKA